MFNFFFNKTRGVYIYFARSKKCTGGIYTHAINLTLKSTTWKSVECTYVHPILRTDLHLKRGRWRAGLTGDDVELGLRHLGRSVSFPKCDMRIVFAMYVFGQTRVHAIVALVDRRHQQVAVRTLAKLLHVYVILHQPVVKQPRDRRVR